MYSLGLDQMRFLEDIRDTEVDSKEKVTMASLKS